MRAEYTERRSAAEAAVVRWAWASPGAGLQRVQPLYAERFGVHGARWLERRPRPSEDADEYGFDAKGRIVIAREHGAGEVHLEELLHYAGDAVVGYRYRGGGEPAGCTLTRLRDGRVVHHVDAHATGGFSAERYVWEGGRVVRIEHEFEYRMSDSTRVEGATVHAVEYDDRGEVAAIVEL